MTNNIDDGGAAFPVIPPVDPSTGQQAPGYPFPEIGLSCRDWFAGQALTGLLSSRTSELANRFAGMSNDQRAKMIARDSYMLADAMIAASKPKATAADSTETGRLREALTTIRGMHLGDCPASQDQHAHALNHITEMRRVAVKALEEAGG